MLTEVDIFVEASEKVGKWKHSFQHFLSHVMMYIQIGWILRLILNLKCMFIRWKHP
jgi:hypothetical protein